MELGLFSLRKREAGVISLLNATTLWYYAEKTNSSQRCRGIGWEATDTNCKNRNFNQILGNIFSLWGQQNMDTGIGISIFGAIQNSSRHSPEQHAVIGCALSEGLNKRTDRGSFQPRFSYGSIILWVCRMSQIWNKSQSHPVKLPFTRSLRNFTLVISSGNSEFFSPLTSSLKFNFVSGGDLFIF